MTNMTHLIHGYSSTEDFHSFETKLSISIAQLGQIMGWSRDDECFLGYKLTPTQIAQIETITDTSLPRNLELYLSTDVD
ncbi:DUF7683 domain-containing protein [Pseudomonas sp. TE3610]